MRRWMCALTVCAVTGVWGCDDAKKTNPPATGPATGQRPTGGGPVAPPPPPPPPPPVAK